MNWVYNGKYCKNQRYWVGPQLRSPHQAETRRPRSALSITARVECQRQDGDRFVEHYASLSRRGPDSEFSHLSLYVTAGAAVPAGIGILCSSQTPQRAVQCRTASSCVQVRHCCRIIAARECVGDGYMPSQHGGSTGPKAWVCRLGKQWSEPERGDIEGWE